MVKVDTAFRCTDPEKGRRVTQKSMEAWEKRWNCFPTLPTDLGNRSCRYPHSHATATTRMNTSSKPQG